MEKIRVILDFLNAETCVSMWNEHITSSSASKDSDSGNYQAKFVNGECVYKKNDEDIYFNYTGGANSFVLGNQKPIHDKLFSRQKITSELQEKIGSENLDCEASVSPTYLSSCQFINKHGQHQMNYFHSPHHRDGRIPQIFYFKVSVDGEDKYVYLSSNGQYAVVYETDMSSFNVVLSSDSIFKSLKDFKYAIEGYSEKLKLFLI